MGCAMIGGFMLLSLVIAVLTVRSAIRTPDYDESWADDREFD
jgi:hypothetical protein